MDLIQFLEPSISFHISLVHAHIINNDINVTPRFLTFDRFQNRSAHFKTGWPVLKREARASLKYPVEMQHGVISQQFRHFAGDSFTATISQCISNEL